uniref:Transcriptional regulator n=1 Tax=Oncorhynchus mykiss TaxID=8022 RepID=Q91421_ONCMY|nr:myc homolog [Oncorhynchus mykiss]
MQLYSSLASKNYDYDSIQPYFYVDNEDEDFYHQEQGQLQPPAPSEDISKKFELLSTPPLSPSRRPSLSSLFPSTSDQLEMVTEFLGDDVVNQSFICDADYSQTFLKSIIIQDCMWSGFSAAAKLEKVVSERLACLQAARKEPAFSDNAEWTTTRLNANYLQDLNTSASECIDPSVAFPYPITDTSKSSKVKPPTRIWHWTTHPNSSSSRGSDSEYEEIDVVMWRRGTQSKRCDPNMSGTRHHSPLVLKRCHVSTHQHNYAAHPSTRHESASCQEAEAREQTVAVAAGSSRRSAVTANARVPGRQITEDYVKRRTHYVLERQRRSEVKLNFFLSLRDKIPEVANNEKASKVVILEKAIECIFSIQTDEQRLVNFEEQLRRKSEHLKQKLSRLQNSHSHV